MGAFTSELTITHLSDDDTHGCWRLWRLAEPLIYEVGANGSNRIIIVSKGFITDGPSIPQFLWSILPVWASHSRAGVIHDYLCYQSRSTIPILKRRHATMPTEFSLKPWRPSTSVGSEVPALPGRSLGDLV